MKVLLTGATGFVGRPLVQNLKNAGHEVRVLTRDKTHLGQKLGFTPLAWNWDALSQVPPAEAFAGVEAVIHLAGEPIAASRWSEEIKKKIYNSRVAGTKNLVQAINKLSTPPKIFISASAVGYYGDRKDTELSESSSVGDGFLAQVCAEWEKAALQARVEKITLVRIGIVLEKGGGALAKLLPIFNAGLGGPIGDGKQWMSWIHRKDLLRLFEFILHQPTPPKVVNATAPNPVTQSAFTSNLARAVHRPALLKVPAFAFKLAYGEMASETLLSSCRALPSAAREAGFDFHFPDLSKALLDIIET